MSLGVSALATVSRGQSGVSGRGQIHQQLACWRGLSRNLSERRPGRKGRHGAPSPAGGWGSLEKSCRDFWLRVAGQGRGLQSLMGLERGTRGL